MRSDEVINAELTRLYKRDGQLTASKVLDEAKRKTSPLHPKFEWDDKKAGNNYRLMQARTLIRVAKIIDDDGEAQKLVHVPKVSTAIDKEMGREGFYKPVSVVAKRLDEFTLAMEAALTKLDAAQRAVNELKKAADGEGKESAVSRISLAMQSIETANNLLRSFN